MAQASNRHSFGSTSTVVSHQSPHTQPCTTQLCTAHGTAVTQAQGRRFLSGIILSCAMLISATSAVADTNKIKESTATGVGVGAVVGTLAAGPFGFFAGSIIGGYIGEGQGYKDSANNSDIQDRIIAQQEETINQLKSKLTTSQQPSLMPTAQQPVVQTAAVTPITHNMHGLARDFSLSLILQFQFGKAEIEPIYRNQLAQLAEFLQQHPQVSATITGFTDTIGAKTANLALSQQRAESVQTVLRQHGVPVKQLHIIGKGESVPVYSVDSPQTRFFERRVLIELTVHQ